MSQRQSWWRHAEAALGESFPNFDATVGGALVEPVKHEMYHVFNCKLLWCRRPLMAVSNRDEDGRLHGRP